MKILLRVLAYIASSPVLGFLAIMMLMASLIQFAMTGEWKDPIKEWERYAGWGKKY